MQSIVTVLCARARATANIYYFFNIETIDFDSETKANTETSASRTSEACGTDNRYRSAHTMVLGVIDPAKTSRGFFGDQGMSNKISRFRELLPA
jgi:hypothetical protein